jgi:F-type H+-transporting ATPase subunit delta
MPRQPTSKRYAQAVFQLAQERDALDSWQGDLDSIVERLGQEDLLTYLEAPQVGLSQKLTMVQQIIPDVDSLLSNMVGLLAQRSSVRLLPEIASQYRNLLDGHKGRERAEVVTAIVLDAKQEKNVAQYLSSVLGKEIILNSRVDPGVVGGLIARVGDQIIDGSTRTRLQELRSKLASTS